MSFKTWHAIDQNPGPRCGAACAVYVIDWLQDSDKGYKKQADAVEKAMKHTGTTNLTPELGSTPANIANYIKKEVPTAKIYAPTEIITNWSLRPWIPFLRPFLILNASTSVSMGFKPTNCDLGINTMIIRMAIKKIYKISSPMYYFSAHFVVLCGDDEVMDPDGGNIISKSDFKDDGWTSVGLDLYVKK
jgi:hypothetical protein